MGWSSGSNPQLLQLPIHQQLAAAQTQPMFQFPIPQSQPQPHAQAMTLDQQRMLSLQQAQQAQFLATNPQLQQAQMGRGFAAQPQQAQLPVMNGHLQGQFVASMPAAAPGINAGGQYIAAPGGAAAPNLMAFAHR
jgi:hypothetical protein